MNRKQTFFFSLWILVLVGLVFLVNKLGQPPTDIHVPPVNTTLIEQRWHEILSYAAAPPLGPKDAPYTLVEFGDFECPQCQRASSMIEGAVPSNGKVNLYFVNRPFPKLHKHAIAASQAAYDAAAQGKFWQMYSAMYARKQQLTNDKIAQLCGQIGINGAAVVSDVRSNKFLKQVTSSEKFCDSIGIVSTPTLVVRENKTRRSVAVVGITQITPLLSNPPWNAPPQPTTTAQLPDGPQSNGQ